MLVYKICKRYSHLLEFGKSYTSTEFAAIIQAASEKDIKRLQRTKILFERSENGIRLTPQ